MEWWSWAIISVAALFVVLPPKYDPAVMFKKWVEGRDR